MTRRRSRSFDSFKSARRLFERSESVMLTTHVQPDADGIGSQSALAQWLEAQGKEVKVINPHPTPRRFRFLEPFPFRAHDPATSDGALAGADLLVVLDISVPERLGRLQPYVERHTVETIVIDHHRGPTRIQGLEVRDVEAAATAEIVYAMLTGWRETITADMATAMYSAIAYDTGGFRYSNTRTRTHEIAADLMNLGADTATANHWLFESVSVGRARLMARLLSDFELSEDGRIAWMSLSQRTVKEVEAQTEDVEGLVEVLRSLEGVKVAVLFKEVGEGITKVSLRSAGEEDVEAFAREYGGGGHKNASGALIEESLQAVADRVVADALERFVE